MSILKWMRKQPIFLPAYEEDEAKQYAVQGLIYSYYLQLSEMLEDYYDYLDVDCIEQDIEKD